MSRFGIAWRVAALAFAFAVLGPPHWLALRLLGRRATLAPILFHRIFLRLFSVRVMQSGSPPAPGEAALVLANHVSWLDIAAIGSLRPLSFVAKSEIAGWPVISALAALQRTIYIDRQRRGATAAVSAAMGHRLAEGELVVLFAEGTTSDGTRLLPFRSALVGAARAALQAEAGCGRVRLQPLAITYPRRNGLPVTRAERAEIAWYGDMELAPHLAAFVQGGPIDVHVVWGAPIAFEAKTDRKAATAAAEAEVRAALRGVGAAADDTAPAPGVRPAPSDLGLRGAEVAPV
ncbi:lysophospholipid acyltransferase family protein [Methylobacterium sp. PvR107]|uniref:lysophospholipid acyltransferase family protein n=1 Tax=Methylobacterium sp. PvR107 TaxID=2806597 RepID=UPI001AEA4D20|nr:lysophospholipid acyltransferase family protein [Methylobacterium sp. PvR107]MBP1183198.1 1-acyl-sn-glycerol-3-phosphate acyltransferase [Methylobacterium sp. PvR107]